MTIMMCYICNNYWLCYIYIYDVVCLFIFNKREQLTYEIYENMRYYYNIIKNELLKLH